jgi:hypothetical protein
MLELNDEEKKLIISALSKSIQDIDFALESPYVYEDTNWLNYYQNKLQQTINLLDKLSWI